MSASTTSSASRHVLPSLFISHGGPNILMKSNKSRAKDAWTRLLFKASGAQTTQQVLDRVQGVVVVSAHWTSDSAHAPLITSVKDGSTHKQVYDFYGFPHELYEIKFDARGDNALASRVKQLIDRSSSGSSSELVSNRGLDHGTWVPLVFAMQPTDLMRIPVVQVSLLAHSNADRDSEREVRRHIALGRALAPLRSEGVLIVGSGSETHNLRRIFGRGLTDDPYGPKPSSYVTEFLRYLRSGLMPTVPAQQAVDTVVHYRERTPHGKEAHPTQEHYLPLAVALGAALPPEDTNLDTAKVTTEKTFDAVEYGEMAMGIYSFQQA